MAGPGDPKRKRDAMDGSRCVIETGACAALPRDLPNDRPRMDGQHKSTSPRLLN